MKSPDKSQDRPAHDKLRQVVHRYKQRNFCVDAVDHILEGQPVDKALTLAVQENMMPPSGNPYHDDTALAQARRLMTKPNIMMGMEILFDEAGMSMPAAIKKQVDLINSTDEYVAQRGLDRYFAMTVPKPATKVEIRQASVMEVIDRPSDSPMASRSLTKVKTIEQGET